VTAPSDRHRVKLAHTFRRNGITWHVWECVCGASSPLHPSPWEANASYAEHKQGLDQASPLPAFSTKGTEEML
jgi:hypothetical protein